VTLKARLGTAAALLALLVACGFGALAYLTFARQMDRSLETVLRSDLERVTSLLASPTLGASFGDPTARGVILQFVGPDERVVMWWGDDAPLPRPDGVVTHERADRTYLVTAAPWSATTGSIRLAHDVTEALASRRALARALVTSGVVVVLAAMLSAVVGVRRLLAPLVDLALQTRAISPAATASVSYHGPADEVGDLADGLNLTLAAIRARRERERAFLLEVAHELAAPLTLVHYHLDGLRKRHPDEGALRAASEAARELLRTSQDLLAVARGELEQALEYRIVDLGDVVRRVADEYPGVTVDAATRAEVAGDPERLMQVTRNIVRNAVQATGSTAGVTVALQRDGDEHVLRVSDTGPGMSGEVREHAFEHGFTRAPDAHRTGNGGADGVADGAGGGIGVGLTVAQRLVEGHGGRIRVAETSQRGTVMEVRLPALEGRIGDEVAV
jgi:two-component system, OmpR family, sensor kinase